MTKHKRTVFDWIESKNINHNHTFINHPGLLLPAADVVEDHSFLPRSFLYKAKPINFSLIGNHVTYSFQGTITSYQIDLLLEFLAKKEGEKQASRGYMAMADNKARLLCEKLSVGMAHSKYFPLFVPLLKHGLVYFTLRRLLS